MVNFVNLFLDDYSDTAVAFFGSYFKVQQLIIMSVNGLIQGCLPIMRFNYQAKKDDRLWQTFKTGTLIATVMMFIGTMLLLLFSKGILSLFSASNRMCSLGISAMRIMSLGFVFSGFSTMIATYEQATDKVFESLIIQLLRQGLLLLPLMWLLNHVWHMNGIWITFPVTEVIVCMIAGLLIKHDRRLHIHVD